MCVAVLPTERVARVEMETKTVRQVGQDLLRLQERLETEKTARCAIQTLHLHLSTGMHAGPATTNSAAPARNLLCSLQ